MLFSLILVHIFLFVSGYLFPLQDLISLFPVTADFAMIFSVLIFLPFWICLVLERKKLDWKIWFGLIIVGLLSFGYELLSINYGFPYGRFEYSEMMGGVKIFDDVPLVLPLIYVPMVFGMYYFLRFLKGWWRVFGIGLGLMLFDVAIDPGITASEVWIWGDSLILGRLYGVPVQNFLGWFLTGVISGFILMKFSKDEFWNNLSEKYGFIWISGVSFSLAYWGGVALRQEYWLSVVVGVVLLGILVLFKRRI